MKGSYCREQCNPGCASRNGSGPLCAIAVGDRSVLCRFRSSEALRAAFSDAVVVVALTGDDRLLVSEFGRVDWLLAFTSVDEFAHYMTARGVAPGSEYRYHTLLGRRIVDEFTARCARPTGVAIDIAGVAPIAFPPTPPGGWGWGSGR